jgi:hypothetical protein
MKPKTAPDVSFLLRAAETYLDAYQARTAQVAHALKGIHPSQGFFIFALLAAEQPRRVLESGRGRGYSTEILVRCFPAARVISVECDRNSPDVEIAAKRLEAEKNVECRFGDARVELPQLLEEGDVVLIDGPKGFRAVKLALRLLRTGRPRAIFLHDLGPGAPVRRFLERRVPSALFSDAPEFLNRYSFLGTSEPRPASDYVLPANAADILREGAMGCIQGEPRNYDRLLAEVTLLQWKERLRDTARKLFAPGPMGSKASRATGDSS